jgi:inward rectifier potassium channel
MAHRRTRVEEENRDLGLGSVVGARRGPRLLERDGTFVVERTGLGWRGVLSSYHGLLTMTWPAFLGLAAAAWLLFNVAFAGLYLGCGPDALAGPGTGGPFLRALFFSVETSTTIGYGRLVPATTAAHLLVGAEAFGSLLGFALVTGLVFARFSRPTADILYSDHALVAPYRGISALMFRIANRRTNQILELEAQVILSWFVDRDGTTVREYEPLALERDRVSVFPFSWTIVHPIDETSPLFGLAEEELPRRGAEVLVLLSGFDETFAQTVRSRTSYTAEEVVWRARFARILDGSPRDGPVRIDLGRLSAWEPVPVAEAPRVYERS